MRTYLVGGAVRDRLLGRDAFDKDYVVVGATPEDMVKAGFRPVGKDFPVFLHPETHAEYALARTERKQGHGYHGFVFHTGQDVTLEADLERRDLTINAMAEDETGQIIDPYGGQADLDARLLRHVSPAFAEDPVRLLRVARFAARYAPLGFRVADETVALMRRMVHDGEADHLVPERVWAETLKALAEPQPSAFLDVLRDGGALAVVFPEVDALYGVPQSPRSHPEIDTGRHVEIVLDTVAALRPGDALAAFCALTHDLGKALTPADCLPHHPDHDKRGLKPLAQLAGRLKVPTELRALAALVCRHHLQVHDVLEQPAAAVLALLKSLDVFRRPTRLDPFLAACEADWRNAVHGSHEVYEQGMFLRAACEAAAAVSAASLMEQGYRGPELGQAIDRARVAAIGALPKKESRS